MRWRQDLTIIPSGVITPIYCSNESLEPYKINVLVMSQSQWCSGLQSESLLIQIKHGKELNRLVIDPPPAVLSAQGAKAHIFIHNGLLVCK